jgi:hypothetical protein
MRSTDLFHARMDSENPYGRSGKVKPANAPRGRPRRFGKQVPGDAPPPC